MLPFENGVTCADWSCLLLLVKSEIIDVVENADLFKSFDGLVSGVPAWLTQGEKTTNPIQATHADNGLLK